MKPQVLWPRVAVLMGALTLAAGTARMGAAQGNGLVVRVGQPGAGISESMFGLFFEDINFGADGGLYPERVKNRSFEFPDPLMGWRRADADNRGSVEILDQGSGPNSHYVRLRAEKPGLGLVNEGFRGIGVEQGEEFTFSALLRRAEGAPRGLRAVLLDPEGRTLGEARLEGLSKEWKRHSVALRPTATYPKARLSLLVEGTGGLDVDLVSLYPKRTFKNRRHGMRTDLAQLLADMKPGFLRFPGGCIVEGRHLETRYEWKKTVGDRDQRPLLVNRWNTEFRHRPTPDYYQSFGLGFYEYFQLSEDIGAEPLPILNCGMACQFNSGELVPLDRLDPFVQDALDLIEFANGPITSKWGRLRADMGHPAPFKLKMLGIGNEQWGPQYVERYRVFARVLKEKHPEIMLVSSSGPSPDGERFDYLWSQLREMKAEIVDEHYYSAPKWFRDNVGRYDRYPRTGPKVFAGEYAAQSVGIARPENRNDWECALSEAAFVTGLERNADVVRMASYAPLFAHVEGWQWTPNLIWFDNLRSYGTPNYYVQKLFATNRGSRVLPVSWNGSAQNGREDLFTSAALDEKAGEVVLKVVNYSPAAREVPVDLSGATRVARNGRALELSSPDLKAENSLEQPRKLAPVERSFAVAGPRFRYTVQPYSLTVLRVGVGRGRD